MPDKPSAAAMRAAIKYNDKHPISKALLAKFIDAEFAPLVEAARKICALQHPINPSDLKKAGFDLGWALSKLDTPEEGK